ncbi:MAG: SDR family NAD(P)-dependent oxidoreductase [Bacteroidota bacterium]
MKDKIVMISGAASGLGYATAHKLALMGATTILLDRSEHKLHEVRQALNRSTQNPNIDYLAADLSLMSEVRRVVNTFSEFYDRLDVLINNVGVICPTLEYTLEGHEKTIATNHYSWFLMTHLLADHLGNSPEPRIINVASDDHKQAKFDLSDINCEKNFNPLLAYANSKLAMISSTYQLAKKLENTHITINCVHPGYAKTQLTDSIKKRSIGSRLMDWSQKKLSPASATKVQMHLATSGEVQGVNGKYWNEECKAVKTSRDSYDEIFALRIWKHTEEVVGLHQSQNQEDHSYT